MRIKIKNPPPELKVALKAAKTAADILSRNFRKNFKVRLKGEIDMVTEIDEKAQKAILKIIKTHFRKDAILAEEGDFSHTAAAPRRWIVDPLDGTTNFAHGYPKFCVSIAFEKEGRIETAVIWDPNLQEVFYAVRGKGAYCNDKKIQVSKVEQLRSALLVTGFPYDLDNPNFNNVPNFVHLLKKAQAIRRDGSAALNLAYTAAGHFDTFWETGVKPWDVAAGILLVEEAGGKIGSFSGENYELNHEYRLLASNAYLFEQMLHELKTVETASRAVA